MGSTYQHLSILIKEKKIPYTISKGLRRYLRVYGREMHLPLQYGDLLRFSDQLALLDKFGNDTLWVSLMYPQGDLDHINESLKTIYAILKASGDQEVMRHLYVERIDLCLYGNSKPFRVRIVNKINDNFDYFYIKKADASRVYGLELEHLISPNRIAYVVDDATLIEEHIAGIPGNEFFKKYMEAGKVENEIRLAKEFVKFNERCFVRLLGDMHSSNYVVEVTPDFEDIHYRLRAIDFDQQSYEPRKSVYLPQYFKQNQPLIDVGIRNMTPTLVRQYQQEERAMIAGRMKYANRQLSDLLKFMEMDELSKEAYVYQLREELAHHYGDARFLDCQTMGGLVGLSLKRVLDGA